MTFLVRLWCQLRFICHLELFTTISELFEEEKGGLSNKMKVSSCCGISLEKGCKIIAILGLVLTLLVGGIFMFNNPCKVPPDSIYDIQELIWAFPSQSDQSLEGSDIQPQGSYICPPMHGGCKISIKNFLQSYQRCKQNNEFFAGNLATSMHRWQNVGPLGDYRPPPRLSLWCGCSFWKPSHEGTKLFEYVLIHSPNANSEKRSQTQIKDSAFGFLEDGRELNYNPHLTNRKEKKIS